MGFVVEECRGPVRDYEGGVFAGEVEPELARVFLRCAARVGAYEYGEEEDCDEEGDGELVELSAFKDSFRGEVGDWRDQGQEVPVHVSADEGGEGEEEPEGHEDVGFFVWAELDCRDSGEDEPGEGVEEERDEGHHHLAREIEGEGLRALGVEKVFGEDWGEHALGCEERDVEGRREERGCEGREEEAV
ncbi:Uncharacterised protein [uncultured archaeon]|nr:Uncharacterised protein [uncultured archaeon]